MRCRYRDWLFLIKIGDFICELQAGPDQRGVRRWFLMNKAEV